MYTVAIYTHKTSLPITHFIFQYGLTPLMMAVSRNHSEVADVLLEAGADVNLQSNDVS